MQQGKITVYIGPMFASKSSHLIGDIDRHRITKKSCVIVKYAKDDRYDDKAKNNGIVTHANQEYSLVPIIKTETLSSILPDLRCKYDVIGIDELQFFPDSVEITQILANEGKIVICAGLDANFLGRPFSRIGEMIAISEEVIKLKAICMKCYADASFSAKIGGDHNKIIEVGGDDKYIAVCRTCFNKI
jgi:thymidine kinase